MPNYRRFYVPGGTYFFMIVTYQRQPIFAHPENISCLRKAIATVESEMPLRSPLAPLTKGGNKSKIFQKLVYR